MKRSFGQRPAGDECPEIKRRAQSVRREPRRFIYHPCLLVSGKRRAVEVHDARDGGPAASAITATATESAWSAIKQVAQASGKSG